MADLVVQERESLLARWRQLVRELPSAEGLDVPTLNDHIPGLLDDLVRALRSKREQTIPEAVKQNNAKTHGLQRLENDFDIEEIVAEYNVLRGCVHDLADANGLNLQGKCFHTLNRVFDQSIGLALQTYTDQQAMEVLRRREEYLAFVAHDLKTPLSAISLAGSILEQKHSDQGPVDETTQVLKVLRRSVQQLQGLVKKVLEESTNVQSELGVKLERREFELWPFVESLVRDLHPVAGTSSTVLRNEVPQDLMVYADANLLRRVFQNLLANAIKYTPQGVVIIGAQSRAADRAVESWVRDNGAGVAEDFLQRIFDKGETDPDKEGGTGLGLAIVKTFVEAHGGKVTVESKEGMGSTFRMVLPHVAKATDAEKR
ncbi:MAG: sensor histidine kinase [Pyrinomonadaceae bacterium]|nr:sensor histidine kinase [Phycisphaerales bacterium]